MSDESTDDTALDRVDTGLDALTLVEVARDLFEAIDLDALREGVPPEEAVDSEELRRSLGGPAGRLAARRLADRVVGSGVTGLVAREVAGRAGSSLVEYLVEQVDPETLGRSMEALLEESEAGVDDPGGPVDDGERDG